MVESITDLTIKDLERLVAKEGKRPYVAIQILSWLYKRHAVSFDEMTNLSASLRSTLKEKYEIGRFRTSKTIRAKDGTLKFVFELKDGCFIESILIPSVNDRLTLCVSTQVGCPVGCSFCRTGKMGFKRNLTQGEILGQIIEVQRTNDITNIVLMGMGEPLANYDASAGAIEIMLNEKAFNFSKRKITLSTSGYIKELKRISESFDIKLAISLNATTDELRDKLMPINKRFPLGDIIKFCRGYSRHSPQRITFEYVMIKGCNDSIDDMKRLVVLLNGIKAKINLIPFNPFSGCDFERPEDNVVRDSLNFLTEKGIQTNIRLSKGDEIMAACGQLAG